MSNISFDINEAKKIMYDICSNGRVSNYSKLYRSTNERLSKILSMYDFKDKNVLSVLASSDQLLSSYFLGAKNVDSFDSNVLTFYYFYLRKWCMIYTKKHYLSADNVILIDAVYEFGYENSDAQRFWLEVLSADYTHSLYYSKLFFKPSVEYTVPFSDDIDKMIELIKYKEPNYRQINLFNKQEFDDKYDIIVMSNILEYAHEAEDDDLFYHETLCKNLCDALNDDGIIICSNILDDGHDNNEIYSKFFDFSDGALSSPSDISRGKHLAYTYTKKKH